jgi:hypothetical protein
MKRASIRLRIPNAFVLIKDAGLWDVPESMRGGAIVSTPSCLAVSCLPDMDGDTEIRIVKMLDAPLGGVLLFEGVLATPSGKLSVAIVPGR